MNTPESPYQAPASPPGPPVKDTARGSLLLGFLLGWAAVFGGYVVLGSLAALLVNVVGNDGNNVLFMLLPLLYALPWALVLGLIVWFAVKNQPRSALGVVLAIASMIGLAILLVAACFGIFALSGGGWH
jgi:hypothetical protein